MSTNPPPPPLVLRVVGDPAPKGSSRAMLVAGRAVNVPSGSKVNERKLKGWAGAVVDAYHDQHGEPRRFHRGAVAVAIVFRLAARKGDLDKAGRPKRSAPVLVVVKPDVDKLVRSTLDALTNAPAFGDDSQVALLLAAKVYVPPGSPLGATLILGELGAANLRLMPAIRDVSAVWLDEISLAINATDLAIVQAEADDEATRARLAAERAEAKKTKKLDQITRGGRKPLLPEVPPFPPPPAPDADPDDDFGVAP